MLKEYGESLLEVLLVVVLVGVIVILLANLPNAMNLINKSNHLSVAKEIAAKQIEDKRAMNYANLVNDSVAIVDSRISHLPSGSGLVLIEDCPVLICTNAEHIKQITVSVTWKDNNKTQKTELRTFIGEGGINQ